jgi:hypothetical protein
LIEKVTYEGLKNCFRVYNDQIELIFPADRGPGIYRFGFIGKKNELAPLQDWGFTAHRLWAAPEAHPRSYVVDTDAITVEQNDKFIRLIKPADKETGIQKEMDIPVNPTKHHIAVTHRLTNRGLWPVDLAPWAISAMSTSAMSIWEYSDLSDPRLKFGRTFISIQQDINAAGPVKVGLMDTSGWCAYWTKESMFVKTFDYKQGAVYPDFGSSVEVYSAKGTLELETIAPLVTLQPGESAEHVEQWFLFGKIPEPFTDEDVATIAKHVPPLRME